VCTTCPPGLYWSVEIQRSLISFFLTNIFTGEVLLQEGLNESVSDGSAEYEDKNGDESDEETRHSPEVDDDTPIVTPKNFGDHMEARPTQSGIPLQRLVQSVKHTKKRGELEIIKEGWMVHFTDKDTMRKRHYWKLDSKSITMYKSENESKYYREVPLSEILSVDSARIPSQDLIYSFEIKTATVVFYVSEDVAYSEDSNSKDASTSEWESKIKSAMTPEVKTNSGAGATPAAAAAAKEEAAPPPAKAKEVTVKETEKEKEGKETEISKAYQIFPDEVLGSGQFGIVYGGVHRSVKYHFILCVLQLFTSDTLKHWGYL